MVHLAVLRSQYAHATIDSIDTSAAKELEDVVAVYTAEDVAASEAPGLLQAAETPFTNVPEHLMFAREMTRYQGKPVAAIVATDRYAAYEALDTIDVSYDRLDVVTDPVAATAETA